MTNTKIQRIEMDSSLNGSEEENAIIVYDENTDRYKLDQTSKMEAGREAQTLGKERIAISDAASDDAPERYSSPTLIELRIIGQQDQVSSYTLKRDKVSSNYYGGPWYFSSGRLTKSEAKEVCDIIAQVIEDL